MVRHDPILIAGMHRSGTSMVTRLLHLCGLDLGAPERLVPPHGSNPEGHWENLDYVLLNDALLAHMKGAWDVPPSVVNQDDTLQDLLHKFGPLAEQLGRRQMTQSRWGWKDPRNSLTLGFWRRLYPHLKLLVCLRHPVAVAHSLSKRNGFSELFGLKLWIAYHQHLQEHWHGLDLMVTHYDTYFTHPEQEMGRLLDWLGWTAPAEHLTQACLTIDRSLRHHLVPAPQQAITAPAELWHQYQQICSMAGHDLQRPVEALSSAHDCQTVNGVSASEDPHTSLIILSHNALSYTKRCLESILANTKGSYEIIVVDNASDEETVHYLQQFTEQHPHCHFLPQKENLGFAAGNNCGLAVARGDCAVLLNSDVVVTSGWLDRLRACAESDLRIGIVGPVTNCISGPQQLAHVEYDTKSLVGLESFAREIAHKKTGCRRPHWRAVGFCLLIKRAVLNKIGGLDERFGRGNFEDDDYCLRARLAGYATIIAEDCFVHHFGGRTFVEAGIDYTSNMAENWRIFQTKWNIPSHITYTSGYDMAPHLQGGFDPAQHACPLPGMETCELPLEKVDDLIAELAHGRKQFQAGLFQRAEATFREILRQVPGHSAARNDLGCVLWQMGRTAEALRELTKALQQDPDNKDAHWNLGQLLQGLGRLEEARGLFQVYLNRHPDAADFASALIALQRDTQPSGAAAVGVGGTSEASGKFGN